MIGETVSETKQVFQKIASKRSAPIIFAETEEIPEYDCDLVGIYQRKNKRTARVALRILQHNDWNISEEHIVEGFKKVVPNTGLLGRWQVLQQNPTVICDTAHNKEGLAYVMEQLQEQKYNQLMRSEHGLKPEIG